MDVLWLSTSKHIRYEFMASMDSTESIVVVGRVMDHGVCYCLFQCKNIKLLTGIRMWSNEYRVGFDDVAVESLGGVAATN